MTRDQAVLNIIRDARVERSSLSGYKRLQRSLTVLGFDYGEARTNVLRYLDYFDGDGKPYKWLADALAPTPPETK